MPTFTRDTMPAVPAGKVMLAEYGDHDRSLDAERTEIDSAIGALHGYPTVRLAHWTRGYVCAGSCMRWQEAEWSVNYETRDGSIHGRRFRDENESAARAYFAEITDPQKVSARRQNDAMLEETVYAPARARAAAEHAARLAADKARKALRRRMKRAN